MALPSYVRCQFKKTSGSTSVQDTTGLSTETAIGGAVGTIETNGNQPNRESAPDNRECRFLGSRWAVNTGTSTDDGVYELVSGTWTLQHGFVGQSTPDLRCTGIHICYDGGIPIMTGVYADNGTDLHEAWQTTDGSTFTNTRSATFTGRFLNYSLAEIVYRNKLHYCYGDSTSSGPRLTIWDPVARSYSIPSAPPNFGTANTADDNKDVEFFILENRLFMIYHSIDDQTAGEDAIMLAEYTSGWEDVLTIHSQVIPNVGQPNMKPTAIYDQTNESVVIIVKSGTSNTVLIWQAYEITTGPLTATLLTSGNYLPTGFATAQNRIHERWRRIVDHNDPDNPTYHLIFNSNSATETNDWDMYEHHDTATLIGSSGSADDSGADAYDSFPNAYSVGGERHYDSSEISAEFAGAATASGGMTYSYKVFGITGSETVSVKFRYNVKEHPDFSTVATIDAVTGGSSSINVDNVTIDNVTADGTTTYTATILTSTESYSAHDMVAMAIEVIYT